MQWYQKALLEECLCYRRTKIKYCWLNMSSSLLRWVFMIRLLTPNIWRLFAIYASMDDKKEKKRRKGQGRLLSKMRISMTS